MSLCGTVSQCQQVTSSRNDFTIPEAVQWTAPFLIASCTDFHYENSPGFQDTPPEKGQNLWVKT